MFTKLDILPLSLYEFKLPKKVLDKLVKDCDEHDWDNVDNRDSKPYMGKSITSLSWHKTRKHKYLREYVESCLEEVRKDLNFNNITKLSVSQMWPNKSVKGQWHHGHSHNWSILTGIIYVKGTTGRTWFSRESEYRRVINFETTRLKEGESGHDLIYKKDPVPGTLIIFPSTLFHSVDAVTNDEPRMTISFNSFPVGITGDMDSLAGVNLEIK